MLNWKPENEYSPLYNCEKVNLFSSVFLIISKYSSTSKVDRVQWWILIHPTIVNKNAFMHFYCPSGNVLEGFLLILEDSLGHELLSWGNHKFVIQFLHSIGMMRQNTYRHSRNCFFLSVLIRYFLNFFWRWIECLPSATVTRISPNLIYQDWPWKGVNIFLTDADVWLS